MELAKFTPENLERLKYIERTAYAHTPYLQMQHCNSWQSVANYCQCSLSELKIMMSETSYVIAATHPARGYCEICDLASIDRQMNLFEVWDFLKSLQLPFTLDARENTSYRMIKVLERRNEIVIAEDTPYQWGGETFHGLKIRPTGIDLTEEAQRLFNEGRQA